MGCDDLFFGLAMLYSWEETRLLMMLLKTEPLLLICQDT